LPCVLPPKTPLRRCSGCIPEFRVTVPPDEPENHSRHEGLQVDLPACTTLILFHCSMDYHRFLACSNVQNLRWYPHSFQTFDLAAFNSLHDFLFNLSCLQNLNISLPRGLGIDSFIYFVFCGPSEHRVWRDIRSVEVEIWFNSPSEPSHLFDQTVEYQQRYKKWWKSFTVTRRSTTTVIINASM